MPSHTTPSLHPQATNRQPPQPPPTAAMFLAAAVAGLRPQLLLLLLLAAAPRGGLAGTPPANLHELECAVHQYAFEYGSAKIASNAAALHAGLNLDNCTAWLTPEQQRAAAAVIAAKPAGTTRGALRSQVWIAAAANFFVDAAAGADTNPGTQALPFRTLKRARDVARTLPPAAITRAVVNIRAGVYYLNETLALDGRDSNVG